eukprot:XP_028354187.1 uncharacterized protein LOC114487613 isoform X1 [Physeter catodon]
MGTGVERLLPSCRDQRALPLLLKDGAASPPGGLPHPPLPPLPSSRTTEEGEVPALGFIHPSRHGSFSHCDFALLPTRAWCGQAAPQEARLGSGSRLSYFRDSCRKEGNGVFSPQPFSLTPTRVSRVPGLPPCEGWGKEASGLSPVQPSLPRDLVRPLLATPPGKVSAGLPWPPRLPASRPTPAGLCETTGPSVSPGLCRGGRSECLQVSVTGEGECERERSGRGAGCVCGAVLPDIFLKTHSERGGRWGREIPYVFFGVKKPSFYSRMEEKPTYPLSNVPGRSKGEGGVCLVGEGGEGFVAPGIFCPPSLCPGPQNRGPGDPVSPALSPRSPPPCPG